MASHGVPGRLCVLLLSWRRCALPPRWRGGFTEIPGDIVTSFTSFRMLFESIFLGDMIQPVARSFYLACFLKACLWDILRERFISPGVKPPPPPQVGSSALSRLLEGFGRTPGAHLKRDAGLVVLWRGTGSPTAFFARSRLLVYIYIWFLRYDIPLKGGGDIGW